MSMLSNVNFSLAQLSSVSFESHLFPLLLHFEPLCSHVVMLENEPGRHRGKQKKMEKEYLWRGPNWQLNYKLKFLSSSAALDTFIAAQ